jgi:hypothetical protein
MYAFFLLFSTITTYKSIWKCNANHVFKNLKVFNIFLYGFDVLMLKIIFKK